MDVWVERELEGCEFPDKRLKSRLGKVLGELGERIGQTLPAACQDWAATKAAYRFFSNPRVDESLILAGHFAATQSRMAAIKGPILILHDTTEFSFKREKPEAIGKTTVLASRPYRSPTTLCGLLMHSSLAITPQGKPLGLAAVKFWTRKKFKGTNALKKKINPTRIPIEQKESLRWLENLKHATSLAPPSKCVHIGDRESDIYELFCAAQEAGTHFLVRTCVDRVAGAGGTTISKKMEREPIRGTHEVEVFDHERHVEKVNVQVRFCQDDRPPTDRQGEAVSAPLPDGPARSRARDAGGEETNPLETPHRSAGRRSPSGDREARLVRAAVENRNVPQSAEIRLQGGRIETADGRAAHQSHRGVMHHRLACVLAHDGQPHQPSHTGHFGLYQSRTHDSQSPRG